MTLRSLKSRLGSFPIRILFRTCLCLSTCACTCAHSVDHAVGAHAEVCILGTSAYMSMYSHK